MSTSMTLIYLLQVSPPYFPVGKVPGGVVNAAQHLLRLHRVVVVVAVVIVLVVAVVVVLVLVLLSLSLSLLLGSVTVLVLVFALVSVEVGAGQEWAGGMGGVRV